MFKNPPPLTPFPFLSLFSLYSLPVLPTQMASHLGASPRATTHAADLLPHRYNHVQHQFVRVLVPEKAVRVGRGRARSGGQLRARVSDGGDSSSYLDMWRNAVDRERKTIEFQQIAEKPAVTGDEGVEEVKKKSEEFEKILETPSEERDRIQRMQVIDRAAAAIAAARAILDEEGPGPGPGPEATSSFGSGSGSSGPGDSKSAIQEGTQKWSIFVPRSENSGGETPGPDFWSWTPPVDSDKNSDGVIDTQLAGKSLMFPTSPNPVIEQERPVGFISIPFESKFSESNISPPLPPLQSLIAVEKVEGSESSLKTPFLKEEQEHDVQFSAHAAEAADALHKVDESLPHGVYPDGSRWWKETGVERRPDGVICRWTLKRGVSADQVVEWQDKYWEASDEFGHKELGSEKSGRNATGSVWREYWKESMWLDSGLARIEKTADKWGKNGQGDEWQEKWWEHYSASGQAEKWAHKWCSIDPNTPLEAGHAHIWHERWGENYDGHGGSTKYTDKWAERCEGDGWAKWGDKWDENFDPNSHGVKQGESWWEGKYGDRWNRTWGEGHNGSGWVHKYGKSSSGEHWDTHVQQDTWYERFPHFGFYHCFGNSVQLREVQKPSEMTEP